MATILLFIYVETESTRCKTGTLNLLSTVGSFYINNCLLFLMLSACSVDDNEMVSWQYGVPSAAVALTQKVDFYWQRERVGGSWVFVAGNLDNASVSAAEARISDREREGTLYFAKIYGNLHMKPRKNWHP